MANRRNLTRQEAADELRFSTKTIDRLRDAGELESFLLGTRSVRIVAASLAAYESRQRQRSGPPAGIDRFPMPRLEQLRAEKAAKRTRREDNEEAA